MSRRLRRRGAVGVVAALVGALAVVGSGRSAEAVTALDACVAKYSAPDPGLNAGQAKVASPSGMVTAAGDVGLTVSEAETTSQVNGKVVTSGSVEVRMGDDSNPAALARAYAAANRSVLDDAQAAGLSENSIRHLCQQQAQPSTTAVVALASGGAIYASTCSKDNSSQVRWEGCTTRYSASDTDPSYNYGIDDAFASGEETSLYAAMTVGGVRNNYNSSYVDITKASPGADLNDVDRCYNATFGVSAAGFGLTAGGTVCPARWDITKTSLSAVPEYHRTEWKGVSYDGREAVALSAIRVRTGKSTGYSLIVNWSYSA